MIEVYRYKNHVYMPVLKNASSTYIKFFKNSGWETCKVKDIIDDSNLNLFGHIQNPDIRHTKGIAETLNLRNVTELLFLKKVATLLSSGIFDLHTFPLDFIYGDLVSKIHWIPMDLKIKDKEIPSNYLTNLYFQDHSLPFRIPDSERQHVAKDEMKIIQNKVKEIKEKNSEQMYYYLRLVFLRDNETWEKSLNYYTEYLKKIGFKS